MQALAELGFPLTETQAGEVRSGKDFGIETFEEAWKRRVEVEGFPVCHLDDIIARKKAANRVKDRESLPRLVAFRKHWLGRRPDR